LCGFRKERFSDAGNPNQNCRIFRGIVKLNAPLESPIPSRNRLLRSQLPCIVFFFCFVRFVRSLHDPLPYQKALFLWSLSLPMSALNGKIPEPRIIFYSFPGEGGPPSALTAILDVSLSNRDPSSSLGSVRDLISESRDRDLFRKPAPGRGLRTVRGPSPVGRLFLENGRKTVPGPR